jgi:NDP-sugar pyrophosphorylase family protein
MLPVAILAGGLGTRLGPLAAARPKALVEIAGKPFVAHQLSLLRRSGVERVVMCVGHLGEQICATVGDGSAFGLVVEYSFDGPSLVGTGGALRRAAPRLGEAFFVLYGDSYLDIDYAAVEDAYLRSCKAALMTVFRNRGQWDRSNVVFRDSTIVRYSKSSQIPEMEHIDYGLGILSARSLALVPSDRPYDLADLYAQLVEKGDLAGLEVDRRFYEVGSPQGLAETRALLGRSVAIGSPWR